MLEKISGIIEQDNLGKMIDILEEHLEDSDYSAIEVAAALLSMKWEMQCLTIIQVKNLEIPEQSLEWYDFS